MTNDHEELQYLELIKLILDKGNTRKERTGTGTKSLFAPNQLRFSCSDGTLPLLTTKRVFYRGILEELLWFLRGETNAKLLQDKNVRIWDGNASREYLDSIGLTERPEGDLGPVYGFQWRHFGAKYDGFRDYSGQGVDQLLQCIQKILTNPTDRRIIMTAWNPADLHLMALPPCHMMCQFYVCDGKLDLLLYQRSCDIGLGVPFNIASYAILLHIVAKACSLEAGQFIHTMGDAHVYNDHTAQLEVQVQRQPYKFPKLVINKEVPDSKDALQLVRWIESLVAQDFQVVDYQCHPKLEMKMSV